MKPPAITLAIGSAFLLLVLLVAIVLVLVIHFLSVQSANHAAATHEFARILARLDALRVGR